MSGCGVVRLGGGVTEFILNGFSLNGLTVNGFTVKGVRSRGEINGDDVAGMRRLRHNVGRKKFGHGKARLTQQVPRSAGTVVVANNFNAHSFLQGKSRKKSERESTDAHR